MQSTDIAAAKKPLRKLPRVLTSFSWDGYEKYGKRFIESWKEFAPPAIQLTVYYEGSQFDDFDFPTGVSWRPIEEVEFLADFMDGVKRFPIFTGIVGSRYDINFDARMGRKTFMQTYHARKYGGKVFWMDADSVLYRNMPESFLDQQLPDDKFACYLGRDGWYFTESGFIGFNADHPLAKNFLRDYVHVFIVGSIFTQAPQIDEQGRYFGGGWHDCIAFDVIRGMYTRQGSGGEFVNLAAHVSQGEMHPHAASEIGKYVKHLKGVKRKETGDLLPGDPVAAS